MHKRLLVLLVFFATILLCDTQNVELIANSIEKDNTIINANGDVLLYSEKYLITADRAIYDMDSGDLELFGNINILYGSEEASRSEYAFLNIKEDIGGFYPFFFFNQSTSLWIRCNEVASDKKYYITKNSVVSSCNVENPDWKIGFSTGKLNKDSSFLHLYNSIFYVRDFPVFYLPYFAFPTDNTRRTGLLKPEFGYEKDEGMLYRQPIYFAPHEWWDLELDPQIRTERGGGIYSTFRFADSIYSNGYISAGIFRDKSEYVKDEDLKNNRHYGYEIYYNRSSIFGKGFDVNGYEDGFLLDFKYLNDIDYLNLKNQDSYSYDRLITSRLNYFLRDESNYIGVYSKYFIDTDTSNNDDTLQEVPTLHYHKFLDSLFINNIQYSFDAKYHNYYRKEGLKAQQFEIDLPVTLYLTFFDDFLRFSISENIYFTRANYDNYSGFNIPYNYGQYFSNYHKMSLFTDLAKPYQSFFHKINIGVDYIVPSFDKKKGYLDRDNFVTMNSEIEQLTFNLKQYFYDANGVKRVVHSIKQPYYIDEKDEKFQPIENKIELFITPEISLSNEMYYSHERGKLSKSLSYIEVDKDRHKFYLSHTYDKELSNNFLSVSYEQKIFKNESIFTSIDYDFDNNFTKSWRIGFKQARKCWDYAIVYRENTTPKLTSSGKASSVNKKGVFFMFNLFPIGGVQYEFATTNSKDL